MTDTHIHRANNVQDTHITYRVDPTEDDGYCIVTGLPVSAKEDGSTCPYKASCYGTFCGDCRNFESLND